MKQGQEQDTWLPGIQPEVDWEKVPVGSIWKRKGGTMIQIMSVDHNKRTVSILRVARRLGGVYGPHGSARETELPASTVIHMLKDFFVEEGTP